MKCERDRLKSYHLCDVREERVGELARGGLYVEYKCPQIDIQCAFCEWEREEKYEDVKWDSLLREHREWSPQCPFLLRKEVGNVPLDLQEAKELFQIYILPGINSDKPRWRFRWDQFFKF